MSKLIAKETSCLKNFRDRMSGTRRKLRERTIWLILSSQGKGLPLRFADNMEHLGSASTSGFFREEESAKWRNSAYETKLASGGSYIYKSDLDIREESKTFCQKFPDSAQTVVQDSLFSENRFEIACRNIQKETGAMVVQDTTWLVVPSAKTLATCGTTNLENSVESVNRG